MARRHLDLTHLNGGVTRCCLAIAAGLLTGVGLVFGCCLYGPDVLEIFHVKGF